MEGDEQFEVMVDVCLRAHEVLARTGTAEMLAVMQVLLFQLGQENARREVRRDRRSAPVEAILRIE